MAETRQFRMHAKLLLDVIRRQAGSLAKAVLEGVMNSVDAKATRCDVTLTKDSLVIADDGAGFPSREAIETFFEEFGHPHDEAEQKVFGTFRMGRGQLFAYGHNTWATGPYRMEVDVANCGLDYDLHDDAEAVSGCRIKVALYDPLLPSDLAEAERLLEHWCAWAPLEVYLNGQLISSDPATYKGWKWDHVTDDAYIKLDRNKSLSIYNLGVHVTDLGSHRYGTGGIVVSRKQLKVNFARNDVQSDCPVWKRALKDVDTRATTANLRTPSLDDAGRIRLAHQWREGSLTAQEARSLRLFTAVTGRHYSLDQLCRSQRKLTACPRGDLLGDKIHKREVVFVLAEDTVERFRFKAGPALTVWLAEQAAICSGRETKFTFYDFARLTRDIDRKHQIVADDQLTPTERVWLQLLGTAACKLGPNSSATSRRLLIGVSKTAAGWTDGQTYVAIERSFLARQALELRGFHDVGALLLHEFCHAAPDTAEHTHTQEFYETFHDHVESIGSFVYHCLAQLPSTVKTIRGKLTRAQLCNADRAEKAARAAARAAGIQAQPVAACAAAG